MHPAFDVNPCHRHLLSDLPTVAPPWIDPIVNYRFQLLSAAFAGARKELIIGHTVRVTKGR